MLPPPMTTLEQEALRVYRRYESEIVNALGLCPWAERARREGRVRDHVIEARTESEAAEAVLAAIDALDREPSIEIGLVLLPRLELARDGFERFVATVRERDAARHPYGATTLALAAFHPEARVDLDSPERLVPLLRRTPDPTIQAVRTSVLERLRRGDGHGTALVDLDKIAAATLALESLEQERPLSARVAEANLVSVRALGAPELIARLDDIRRDRDRAYAALDAVL